jgi:hypothetical protein
MPCTVADGLHAPATWREVTPASCAAALAAWRELVDLLDDGQRREHAPALALVLHLLFVVQAHREVGCLG